MHIYKTHIYCAGSSGINAGGIAQRELETRIAPAVIGSQVFLTNIETSQNMPAEKPGQKQIGIGADFSPYGKQRDYLPKNSAPWLRNIPDNFFQDCRDGGMKSPRTAQIALEIGKKEILSELKNHDSHVIINNRKALLSQQIGGEVTTIGNGLNIIFSSSGGATGPAVTEFLLSHMHEISEYTRNILFLIDAGRVADPGIEQKNFAYLLRALESRGKEAPWTFLFRGPAEERSTVMHGVANLAYHLICPSEEGFDLIRYFADAFRLSQNSFGFPLAYVKYQHLATSDHRQKADFFNVIKRHVA